MASLSSLAGLRGPPVTLSSARAGARGGSARVRSACTVRAGRDSSQGAAPSARFNAAAISTRRDSGRVGLGGSVQPAPARPYQGREDCVRNVACAMTADAGEVAKDPAVMRWRYYIFALLWTGYAVFYFTRLSFTFAAPTVQAELSLSIQEIGRITSVFPIMYGFSKFAAGVGADVLGSRMIFAIGLLASGALNLLMGQQQNLAGLTILWAMNGFFQGFGAPACAKLLTQWYPAKSRGTWWALWCTANNIGGFATPLMVGSVTAMYGWRWGMMVPGIIGIAMGVIILIGIRNKPEDVGLPPANPPAKLDKESATKDDSADKATASEIMTKYVLRNKAIWALAFAYFFVYVVRQGLTSWTVYYIMNVKGIPDPATAAATFAPFELGGLFGGFASGILSDKLGGHRVRVVCGYLVGLAACLIALSLAPFGNAPVISAAIFMVGFAIYGPQMLVGLIGAELSHPLAVATGNGLLGWISYMGAACAGEPLAIIVKKYGWGLFFSSMLVCCVVPLVLLLPFWNARRYEDLNP